jgi:deoxyribonuclease-4
MPRFGAHVSVAGGLPRAVERAIVQRCDALQIFAKNANQWRGRALPRQEVREFRSKIRASGIAPAFSHASYLINLGTDQSPLRDQSIEAMGDELDRAEALGLTGVVLHPGCYTHGNPEKGVELVAEALVEIIRARRPGKAMVLLEHTAGQGTALGANFEQIAAIIDLMNGHRRVGVCLDTCHLLASGYDISSPEGYLDTFRQFGRLVGFERLKLFHLNDSKKPLNSRVDRHTHIGEGCVGLDGFRRLVNDRRFLDLPMLLETPKTERRGRTIVEADPFDAKNLNTLRQLVD